MQAGPALDRAVAQLVFRRTGKKAPPYSTDRDTALSILEELPLFVASDDPSNDKHDPSRPWLAGRFHYDPAIRGFTTIIRVSAATLEVALCKAALLVATKSTAPAGRAVPAPARVATPAGAPETSMQDRLNAASEAAKQKVADARLQRAVRALPRPRAQPSGASRSPREPIPPRKALRPGEAAATPQTPGT